MARSSDVLKKLEAHLPLFLQYELFRPILRDVLENGKGLGRSSLHRTQVIANGNTSISASRIVANSYPIFEDHGRPTMSFRYMRAWIERAYTRCGKAVEFSGEKMSPLLHLVLDQLDVALDESCLFDRKLRQGEIVYTNNLVMAHRRRAFSDIHHRGLKVVGNKGSKKHRHMVRVWLQEE